MYSRMLLAVLVFISVGCSPEREVGDDFDKIESEWSRQEWIIDKALNRKGYEDLEYIAACGFFQRITGIQIENDVTPEGLVPAVQASRSFAAIRRWYKENRHKLCWNDEAESVELCRVGGAWKVIALRPSEVALGKSIETGQVEESDPVRAGGRRQ